MQIDAIVPQTTAELVVERTAQVIRHRGLSAGDPLPREHELVEQLKVSRPVLREALARLQSIGLVDIQRGRGTFVGNATSLANCLRLLRSAVTILPIELQTYAELRSAIEVQSARQASERATKADVEELSALLKRLDDEELPYPEALEIDFRFHRKLLESPGNPWNDLGRIEGDRRRQAYHQHFPVRSKARRTYLGERRQRPHVDSDGAVQPADGHQ
jgi:GntR family transcriptional regulator, transcriptional repressor for pyruvate dehydrogenase complex